MVMRYADPFDTLFAFQQALENRQLSDWLGTSTAALGSYPPINVFQQGDDLVAIIELPGVNKDDLNIQAKENTIRISGRKSIDYPEDVSLHRRERLSGAFDRTLVVPMQIDPDGIRLSITPACWRCSSRAPSGISREPSRSSSQGEQDDARTTRTASAAKARGGQGARGHTADACFPTQYRHLRDR